MRRGHKHKLIQKNYTIWLIVLACFIAGIVVGLLITKLKSGNQISNALQPGVIKTSPLFKTQTATVQGKVTEVANGNLKIINDKGQEEIFPLAKNVLIYKPQGNSKQTNSTTDLSQLTTNQDVFIVLQAQDGAYKVISVTYLSNQPAKK